LTRPPNAAINGLYQETNMEDIKQEASPAEVRESSVRDMMREVIGEFLRADQAKSEPAYKSELLDERRRREGLEKRLSELEDENRRTRERADEAERHTAIRRELQKHGVQKLDLAFKAVSDDIQRAEDGRLVAKLDGEERPLAEYIQLFVAENPELLPARIAGGSGATGAARPVAVPPASPLDLDSIHPGMSAEEMERVRREISRLTTRSLRLA